MINIEFDYFETAVRLISNELRYLSGVRFIPATEVTYESILSLAGIHAINSDH